MAVSRGEAQALVTKNMGLIHHIARKVGNLSITCDEDDLVQSMLERALAEFEKRFDPTRSNAQNFLGCILWRQVSELRKRHWERDRTTPMEDFSWGADQVTNDGYFVSLFDDLKSRLGEFSPELSNVLDALQKFNGDVQVVADRFGKCPCWVYSRIGQIRESPIGQEIAAAL